MTRRPVGVNGRARADPSRRAGYAGPMRCPIHAVPPVALLWGSLVTCAVASPSAFAADWPGSNPSTAAWSSTEGGVEVQDPVVGDGEIVEDGATVEVHYTGLLADGTVFDASTDRGQTFQFRLGAHQVIPGWEQGLVGMRVGGTRRIVIPPDLGYGHRATGPIPADSVLYFEVSLISMKAPRRAPATPAEVPPDGLRELPGGVRIADLSPGDGKLAKLDGRVCADWVAWGTDGAPIESTYPRRACTWFRLDGGTLPDDVDRGLAKARAGGRRQIVLPSGVIYEFELSDVGK